MYSYYTKLDIEECKKRINEAVRGNRFSMGEMRGKVNSEKNKFYLLKTKAYYSNSFSRIFYGELIKKENGTIIQGSFCRHIIVKLFMTIWFGGVIFVGGIMFLVCFSNVFLGTSNGDGNSVLGLIIPPIMFIFGILLVKSGVWFSINEEKYVLEFIRKTLKGEEVEIQDKKY